MDTKNIYTQTELMEKTFKRHDTYILESLLKPGLYILAGPSKAGKSMIATSLADAVTTGKDYLGRKTDKGSVIYFDNDNYAPQTKDRLQALNLSPNDNLIYNFEDAQSFSAIEYYIQDNIYSGLSDLKMVVIDCYANLYDLNDIDNYKNNYEFLKSLSDFAMKHNFCMVLVHHTKKKTSKGQDALLGSRALTAATSGSITLEVESDFSKTGILAFNLRHIKDKIPIIKDDQGINWHLNEDEELVEDGIDENILSIIHTLAKHPLKEITGTVQELSAIFKYTQNPKGLYHFLKRNNDTLLENSVMYKRGRTGQERTITIYIDYKDD